MAATSPNGIHSMLALTGPPNGAWIRHDKIAALNASTVIAGHSAATLDRTRDCIEAFIEGVEEQAISRD